MLDKFGVKELYPTVDGGLEWFADWSKNRVIKNNQTDPLDHRLSYLHGTLTIDSCRAKILDYAGSHRIFVKGPWTNTEMTVYAKVIGKASSIQLRSRSNHHGTNNEPYGLYEPNGPSAAVISCGFGAYEAQWDLTKNQVEVELEIIHDLYRRDLNVKSFTIPKNQYIGYKAITRTKDNNKVLLEVYNDKDIEKQNWIKTTQFEFDGKNASVSASKYQANINYCSARGDKIASNLNANQVWLKPGYWNWLRFNDAENIYLKSFSIREIAPL